jgi:glutaredoxin
MLIIRQWFAIFLLLTGMPLTASSAPIESADNKNVLEVFVRDGCPHCAEAKAYLPLLKQVHPDLNISLRWVDRDEGARNDLIRYSKSAAAWPPGVPTFVFNGKVLIGFESPAITGPALEALVSQTYKVSSSIESGLFGTLSVSNMGLPLFTLALGLLDGFNPCAMWVLLFLLSLLVHLRDRKRMAIIAGTFVLVSGAVYYAFMAAWLNVFLLVGFSMALRLALGSIAMAIGAINLKDFILGFNRGVSLSIPDSAKPGIYARMRNVMNGSKLINALLAVALLAVAVNFIELLCTAGFPAIYTAVLAQQDLTPAAHYGYLGLYILGYITDDTLMVAMAVTALSSNKLSENAGRWLKFVSGAVMLALGAVLLFRPEWLI